MRSTIHVRIPQPFNCSILLLGLLAALPQAFIFSGVDAADMVGWKVEGRGAAGIVERKKYSFLNIDQDRYLTLKDIYGANLGWDTDSNEQMEIKRINPGSGPIKCGEAFGLSIRTEWLVYDRQKKGIHLSTRPTFSNDPAYHWVFTNCHEGEVVALNQSVGLKSLAGSVIVGCRRMGGVNLCWADDVTTVNGKNYHRKTVPRRLSSPGQKLAMEIVK